MKARNLSRLHKEKVPIFRTRAKYILIYYLLLVLAESEKYFQCFSDSLSLLFLISTEY